jgi:hypothetical protein
MRRARILDWPKTPRYLGRFNDPELSSQRQFCPDCIIATPGYDFREGQEPVSEVDKKLWEQAIAEDFAEFRKVGLTHPMMADVEKELGISR